ncbi:DUF6809 family protein [Paenibacillus sp. GM2]|uniref:DUF6809 family protein n=1 Tax=Paenibacillus sp. GM2 TaxID=1622070 RepID=UPI000839571A|nr:DUF6809 family protein [Paenibacillus sp. GM2]
MPSLLESLYYGHLNPEEQVVPKDPEYRQNRRELSEAMEALKKKLSAEDFTELEALMNLQYKIQGMEMTAAFRYGFRLGAAMLIEVHFGDGVEQGDKS